MNVNFRTSGKASNENNIDNVQSAFSRIELLSGKAKSADHGKKTGCDWTGYCLNSSLVGDKV